MADPIILTALLDADTQRIATDLRRRFFPPERNYLDAHLTLAHHLPGAQCDALLAHVRTVVATRQPFPIYVRELIDLGKGTALRISTAPDRKEIRPLVELRAALLAPFAAQLTPQDRRPWRRPHLTIQNKVDKATARALQRRLGRLFEPRAGRVIGVGVYAYRGGPWARLAELPFGLIG